MPVSFQDAPTLPDWLDKQLPFNRRMAAINGSNMHFIDHGEGRPVLMQHGNPMWCYLWRKVATALEGSGLRLIIPDMIGLGLSTKPHSVKMHSLSMHIEMLTALVEALDLSDLVIVGQDWGGPWSSGMAARVPQRVTGAVFANTAILSPQGKWRVTPFHKFANRPVISDIAFRFFNFPIPMMHKVQGDPATMGRDQKRAYAFPLQSYAERVAPLALARMVPWYEGHPTLPELAKCDAWARSFQGPVELVWGLRDPILGRSLGKMKDAFPDARVTETQAGHFLQEEVPEELAAAIKRVAGVEGA